jgi:hypothetical protein
VIDLHQTPDHQAPFFNLTRSLSAVTTERPGRRELSELVPDHLLGDVHVDVVPAVVNQERMPDELRRNGRSTRPRFDRLFAIRRIQPRNLLQQVLVDERTFFQ